MLSLKKIGVSILVFTQFFTLNASPYKNDSANERMKSHVDMIKNIFDVVYAPKDWKESYLGWNLENATKEAKQKIDLKQKTTLKDFQRILKEFLAGAHDHHVTIRFHSTERAFLPFLVKGTENRYFISQVDYDLLSPSVYRIEVGDELVSFDGRPVHEEVLKIQKEEFLTTEEGTDRSLAEIYLTQRSRSKGMHVPSGGVMIGIKKLYDQKIREYQLSWNYEPEEIKSHFQMHPKNVSNKKLTWLEKSLNNKMMTFTVEDLYLKSDINKESSIKIGSKKGVLQNLGKLWWKSDDDSSFRAYIYENEAGQLIGYIRIPTYGASGYEASEFREIIELFEERTEALVIDQMNNPGGSLFYMYALASYLTEQPLKVAKHQVALDQSYIEEAIEGIPLLESITNDAEAVDFFGDDLMGYPVTYQMVQLNLSYYRFILDEWSQGKTLTNPTHLYGVDCINPNPYVKYTKPILILANELSFSAADFFPAIFQDNQRGTIMGKKTAGAGGFISSCHYPNLLGIKYIVYTRSIASRPNREHSTIENLGVTPDCPYEVTIDDLKHSYRNFAKEINNQVFELLYRERG